MKKLRIRTLVVLAALAAGLIAAGCAKKAAQAPPTPPPAPPQAATTPAPAPEPTTPPPTPPAPTPSVSEAAARLQPVFYDFDSYTLTEAARGVLDGNARVLREVTALQLTIEGHCDERGTVEYNQALGERRAAAARDYLVAAGIDGSRLSIISYGKERPFATGSDEASWAQNRRAHFVAR
jgi:peptidoglycan-associated lipoprotein